MPMLRQTTLVAALAAFVCSGAASEDIEALLAQMTLDEKIGQMTQAERGSASPDDVRDFFLGSILSGGGSAPASNAPTTSGDDVRLSKLPRKTNSSSHRGWSVFGAT